MSDSFDGLLARSRSPGRFVERRRFTLAREKAVEKLREFSLRYPEQYILELVQAAVFAGARWIAIDIAPERLFFAWVGGRSFTAGQLENVFDYLFADRTDPQTRHVVQLAVALNALLQRRPKVLRIESGDGSAEGTVRLDLDPQGQAQLGRPEDPFQGSYLVVEHAQPWFARFQQEVTTREQGLVEERCIYSPVPILLNHRAPFGYRQNREIRLYGMAAQRSFVHEGRHGVLGIPGDQTRVDGIRLVVGGVWITSLPIPELGLLPSRAQGPEPLVGVICDDRLRKTADQSDLVQDGRWIDMLHAVQPEATALIMSTRFGAGFRPPPLPGRVAEPARNPARLAQGPQPEALPEQLEQVAPRPSLRLEQVQALPAGRPVFWVDRDTAGTLGLSGEPSRFPYRLFLLSPGQALSLAMAAPQLSLGAIRSAADAEFVGRSWARRGSRVECSLPVEPADGLGSRGSLHLVLHLGQPRPAWGPEEGVEVPVYLRVARRPAACGGLPLGLPGLSAELELDGGSYALDAGAGPLVQLLRQHAWRLAAAAPLPSPGVLPPDELRAFVIALLAMQAQPQLYAGDGVQSDPAGAEPQLSLSLPEAWDPALRARLWTYPLARLADGGLLDLQGLLAHLRGEGDAAPLLLHADEDPALLLPLELRLGPGHLHRAGALGRSLLAVALVGQGLTRRWTLWPAERTAAGGEVHAILWLGEGLAASLPGLELPLRPCPVPALGLASTEVLPGAHDGLLRSGLVLLASHLGTIVREDLWTEIVGSAQAERVRPLGRLALLGIACWLQDDEARVLPRSDGQGWLRLDALSRTEDGRPPARVALRHGPAVAEPDTVLLSWDEVRTLRQAGRVVPLRFDDPPEVWASLVRPSPAPADSAPEGARPVGWILREQLQVPGLEGWLGLREPYDPTSVVLLQQSGELLALDRGRRALPCHGLAWTLGSQDGISQAQRDLLDLMRLRLYQGLADQLEARRAPADAAWREVATAYAIDFAVASWQETVDGPQDGAFQRPLDGTAARLLQLVELWDAQGRPLGRLADWLQLEPAQRPMPRGPAARWREARRQVLASAAQGGDDVALSLLERRLGTALSLASGRGELQLLITTWKGEARQRPVRVRDEASGPDRLGLELNLLHPLVPGALDGEGDAREILLIEAARVACGALRELGQRVDLLELHQLLAAQRV